MQAIYADSVRRYNYSVLFSYIFQTDRSRDIIAFDLSKTTVRSRRTSDTVPERERGFIHASSHKGAIRTDDCLPRQAWHPDELCTRGSSLWARSSASFLLLRISSCVSYQFHRDGGRFVLCGGRVDRTFGIVGRRRIHGTSSQKPHFGCMD